MRTWLAVAAAVLGGVLMAVGAADVTAGWLFAVLGGLAALAGLVNLGQRGGVSLLASGLWPVAFWVAGLAEQWVLLSGGLLVVTAAFVVVAAAAPELEPGAAA